MSGLLLQEFDRLAHAPGGVARLRELILSLAVRGQLVPQDPSDEPATELMHRVRVARENNELPGRGKRGRPPVLHAMREEPFTLPAGWVWSTLPDLCAITGGSTPSKALASNWIGGIPWVSPKDMKVPVIEDAVDHVSSQALAGSLSLIPSGSLLMVVRGMILAHSFPVAVTQVPVTINQDMKALTPFEPGTLPFLMLLCQGMKTEVLALVDRSTHGTCKLESHKVFGLPIPLPPLAEQSRIVTCVDELMQLCDALEAKGRLEAQQHARLLETLLGTLTDSTTPEELAANWQRVAEHFDLLLDRPQAVDVLEQTVLQLAVRGLLVSQLEQEEAACVWLARLKSAPPSVAGARSAETPSADLVRAPFKLPAGWAFSSLSEMCSITGGATPSKAVASNWSGDIPWVSPKDMKVPTIEDAQDHVSRSALKGSLSLIQPGSLLMVVRGMILAHSFPVAVTRVPVTINQDMKALTPLDSSVLPYLSLVCMGMKPEILALVERSTHGTCKLESAKIFSLPIPLPPLAEQARIVARVIELRCLCADLRRRLAASQATQSRLAGALVESVATA